MNHQHQIGIKQFWVAVGISLLVLPLILYAWLHFSRPPRTNQERSLFQGITYRREVRSTPRPMMIHIVTVDLKAPGIRVLVTPGRATSDNTDIEARTTSEFVKEFKLQLAVNASFFHPFREKTPWDYFPKSGDRVNILGQAISNGSSYSKAQIKWPMLCFFASKAGGGVPISDRAQIQSSEQCPSGTVQAVAGNEILIMQGKPIGLSLHPPDNAAYPRVAVALNQEGEKLWLIVIDGKQPLYSEGATMAELTKIVKELGAYTALNLDGGGSTTLVATTPEGLTLLNAPIHTKLPMRQRPVANHIGFYALPIRN